MPPACTPQKPTLLPVSLGVVWAMTDVATLRTELAALWGGLCLDLAAKLDGAGVPRRPLLPSMADPSPELAAASTVSMQPERPATEADLTEALEARLSMEAPSSSLRDLSSERAPVRHNGPGMLDARASTDDDGVYNRFVPRSLNMGRPLREALLMSPFLTPCFSSCFRLFRIHSECFRPCLESMAMATLLAECQRHSPSLRQGMCMRSRAGAILNL